MIYSTHLARRRTALSFCEARQTDQNGAEADVGRWNEDLEARSFDMSRMLSEFQRVLESTNRRRTESGCGS